MTVQSVTRHGVSGAPAIPYGDFTGKVEQVIVEEEVVTGKQGGPVPSGYPESGYLDYEDYPRKKKKKKKKKVTRKKIEAKVDRFTKQDEKELIQLLREQAITAEVIKEEISDLNKDVKRFDSQIDKAEAKIAQQLEAKRQAKVAEIKRLEEVERRRQEVILKKKRLLLMLLAN